MGLDSAKIYKDVSYVYRYGLGGGTYLPVEQYNDALSTPISNKTNEVISARSGIKITNNISVSFDYKQSMNTGKSYQFKTTGGDYYDDINDIIADGDTLTLLPYDSSLTRSYLPLGQVGKDGFPFPSYSLTWRFNPRQVKWLKDRIAFIQSINFQHRMSASEKLSYQYNDDPSIAAVQERYSNYSLNFSPLVKARIKFKGNLSTDIGYNKTIKTDNEGDVINNFTNTSVTRTFSDDITMSLSYSYNKGIIIPVPFLKVKKLNLDNNITFSMSGKYGKSKKEVKQIGSTEFNDPRINKTNWEISPQLSYKFSKNIEGQLFFKYGQQVDKTQMGEDGKFKTSDYKDFGLTVKIRISG